MFLILLVLGILKLWWVFDRRLLRWVSNGEEFWQVEKMGKGYKGVYDTKESMTKPTKGVGEEEMGNDRQ